MMKEAVNNFLVLSFLADKEFGYTDEFGDWVFCYFGYSFITKEAYSYIKYRRREDSYLFTKTYHFWPTYFHVFLGNDGLYPQFEVK